MSGNDILIRPETENDWREVENLTREAFWNKYRPGCYEHYVLNRYRQRPDFVRELDYVIESGGIIVAHIMYCNSELVCADGAVVPLMTFGPVSVLPEYQGRGYGSRLIRFTLDKARALGCGAVAITGAPAYYRRFGFVSGYSCSIHYAAVPCAAEAPFFLVRELRAGYLAGRSGVYNDPAGYIVDAAAVDAFDAGFPPKEKLRLPGQLV